MSTHPTRAETPTDGTDTTDRPDRTGDPTRTDSDAPEPFPEFGTAEPPATFSTTDRRRLTNLADEENWTMP
jgi:hypothetical protein